MEQDHIYTNVGGEDAAYVDNLACPVCLEPYDEGRHTPRMMPCLHTLCSFCIASLTSKANKKAGQTPTTQRTTTTTTSNTTTTTTTTATNTRSNPFITRQSSSGHPFLRRLSGLGPSSPTTRHPHDPLPSPPVAGPTPPTTPTPTPTPHHAPVRRPEVSPPQPPTPPEPQIPKGLIVMCPLCRSEVNTSKLQTNRYVLAHMRDLKRLSIAPPTPQMTLVSQDLWCEECQGPATNTCVSHTLTPVAKWVEMKRATLESLKVAVEDQLNQHSGHLEKLQDVIKDTYHCLNKASRFIWEAQNRVQEIRERVENQQLPSTASLAEEAEVLAKKVTWLEGEAARTSQLDMTQGDSDVFVTLSEEDKKRLLILTYNPDLSLNIYLSHSHII